VSKASSGTAGTPLSGVAQHDQCRKRTPHFWCACGEEQR
jgi:hypothetical protein